MSGHGYVYCCEECDQPEAKWRITREGDVATTWACDEHLSAACERLQRDWEITRLIVTLAPKSKEWAEIGASLRTIDSGSTQP